MIPIMVDVKTEAGWYIGMPSASAEPGSIPGDSTKMEYLSIGCMDAKGKKMG